MSDWPGLTTVQARELAREYAIAIASANCLEAMPSDAWLDVRLRALDCPDDQLAAWRERIKSTPLRDVAPNGATRRESMSKFPGLQQLLRSIDACIAEQPNATDEDIRCYLMGERYEVMRHVHVCNSWVAKAEALNRRDHRRAEAAPSAQRMPKNEGDAPEKITDSHNRYVRTT